MNSPVTFRARARRDVLEQMLYLEEQANEELAMEYYAAVLATSRILAAQQQAGKPFRSSIAGLKGLRSFPLPGAFKKYLIFYRPTKSGIDIARVLHGSRDIETVLVEETLE